MVKILSSASFYLYYNKSKILKYIMNVLRPKIRDKILD